MQNCHGVKTSYTFLTSYIRCTLLQSLQQLLFASSTTAQPILTPQVNYLSLCALLYVNMVSISLFPLFLFAQRLLRFTFLPLLNLSLHPNWTFRFFSLEIIHGEQYILLLNRSICLLNKGVFLLCLSIMYGS